MVPANSHGISRAPRYSGVHWSSLSFAYGGVTFCAAYFHLLLLASFLTCHGSYNPHRSVNLWVWALPRSLATTGGINNCSLFLPVLRCFSSRRSLIFRCSGYQVHWVAPFGYLRINGHLHLPGACRSLSRPSSPSRAKASACCPFLLLSIYERSYFSSVLFRP